MVQGLLIAAGYGLGSMPFAYWLPRVFRGADIRESGSGNVGASNVWRSFGWRLGLPALLLDVLKGVAAALLGRYLADELTGVLAGTAALAGHWRPLLLGFRRGGKIVATTGGVLLAVAPAAGLCACALWILVFLASRYASVASICSGASLPAFALLFHASWPVLGFTIGAGLAIAILHRSNVRRLLHGEERRSTVSFSRALRRRSAASL